MASEITVTTDQADERMDRGAREGGNLLTANEIGTNCGRRQTDPGIFFHSVCVNSQTRNACMIVTANSRKKMTATPGGGELARYRQGIR